MTFFDDTSGVPCQRPDGDLDLEPEVEYSHKTAAAVVIFALIVAALLWFGASEIAAWLWR